MAVGAPQVRQRARWRVVTSVDDDLMHDEFGLQQAVDAAVLLVFAAYDGYGALFFARRTEPSPLPE